MPRLNTLPATPAQDHAFHPLADLFPLMTGVEFDELVADIKQHGLREPIVKYEEKILDGRNRYRACRAADVEPVYAAPFAGNHADAAAFVISANIHRRHLTSEQKNDLVVKLLKATPEKSDRQIAKLAKRDHKTVTATRKRAVARGEIPHVAIHTDTKGRKQPATKPARQAKPAPVEQPAAEEEKPLHPMLSLLRYAWDGAPPATKRLFVEANSVELRQMLVANQAIEGAMPPPLAPIPDDYPDLPTSLDRSRKLN